MFFLNLIFFGPERGEPRKPGTVVEDHLLRPLQPDPLRAPGVQVPVQDRDKYPPSLFYFFIFTYKEKKHLEREKYFWRKPCLWETTSDSINLRRKISLQTIFFPLIQSLMHI